MNDINLPEPVAWIAEYGGDIYTADQLRAAVEADRVQRQADFEDLLSALRQIAEWPDGGNRYGQRNIKRFAQTVIDATIDAALKEEGHA